MSNNGNKLLRITWTILSGEHANRLVFDQAMLSGSENAVSFGRQRIKAMITAMGFSNPNYLESARALLENPCFIEVEVESREGKDDRNKIVNYSATLEADDDTYGAPPARGQGAVGRGSATPPPTGAHPKPPTGPPNQTQHVKPPTKTPPPPNSKRYPERDRSPSAPAEGPEGAEGAYDDLPF
jgi:hypothetical protein